MVDRTHESQQASLAAPSRYIEAKPSTNGSGADMSEQWSVKGQIVVDHLLGELTEAYGARSGLSGIAVKVSARSKMPTGWGRWNGWGQVTTGQAGHFDVTQTDGGDLRQFKVEILFDSNQLRIKQGRETSVKLDSSGYPLDGDLDLTDKDWHEVLNDSAGGVGSGGRQAGVIDLGSIALTTAAVRKHADIWCLYQNVLELFKSYGSEYAFSGRVVVKYPMLLGPNSPTSASYSNPVNRVVYIKEDEFYSRTMIHELMHQWAYDRSTGEDSMAWQLAKHATAHRTRENTTFVPFHEGFAQWACYKALKEMTGGELLNFTDDIAYTYPDLPLNRSYIGSALGASGRDIANVDFTETGWHSLFNILTVPFLDRCDFNRSLSDHDTKYAFYDLFGNNSYPDARLAFTVKDVLGVFLKYPAKGISAFMTTSDMTFVNFLARAGAILPDFTEDKIRRVKSYLDPNSTTNPLPVSCGT
jgi:hypothetical protein